MASLILKSPPDALGFLSDTVFQYFIVSYLGQPVPILALLVGRFFGKKGATLDTYGANLESTCLTGGDHCILHNEL